MIMARWNRIRPWILPPLAIFAAVIGIHLGCDTGGILPTPPGGNRPPIVQITAPSANTTVDAGDTVTIAFVGEDGEDQSQITIFVDPDESPTSGNEITLRNDLFVGPGQGSGQIIWDTDGVAPATYTIFASIDDGVNPSVLVAGLGTVQVVPMGTNPLTNPPELQFFEPVANLGIASGDTVQVRYRYRDSDSTVRLTLLLDKDRNPTNDDVNNPGDPLNPASNIIILPSTGRQQSDPILPPDQPGQPPAGADSVEIRTNPRNLPATSAGDFSTDKLYIFTVDFSQIPIRADGLPYFLRATIDDGDNPPVHLYATSSITITGLASGFVNLGDVGKTIAGAKFQGFSQNERLGTTIIDAGDGDMDRVNDFMIVGQFGSPRNRSLAGAAYLVRGRRKSPFPTDTNSNGLPDTPNPLGGDPVDFPQPPVFIAGVFDPDEGALLGPYRPENTGRYGGTISVNSLGSFLRGVVYGMPGTRVTSPVEIVAPPPPLVVPGLVDQYSGGLTSVAQVELTGDGVTDYVFGLPYICQAAEFHDDDPCDANPPGIYGDGSESQSCDPAPSERVNNNDDIVPGLPRNIINQGMVIVVSGANDVENDGSQNTPNQHQPGGDGQRFSLFIDAAMAGQFDPDFAVDDEGIVQAGGSLPVGVRLRGAWFTNDPEGGTNFEETSEFGATVASLPSFDNDTDDELLISVPGHFGGKGRISVLLGQNIIADGFYGNDAVRTLPSYGGCGPVACTRLIVVSPVQLGIYGEVDGDRLGNARPAGQFNQDGTTDIICGAPAADRDGLTDNGVVYILFTPAGGFGETDLATESVPRVELHGTHNGDAFGEVVGTVGDVNGDGVDDVFFASQTFDDDLFGLTDAGYVGIIFGDRPLTGENVFSPEQVATPQLPGVRFRGNITGARAGASVAGAGDFNQDGFDDILIAAPGETRVVSGTVRLGVSYLIFGGPHLNNQSVNLSDVGNPQLPGVVFVSPYVQGTLDQAAILTVAGIGDVDADGFADVAFGAPLADFVNPNSPNQRRIDAGETWVVYGSNFGTNELPQNQN